jgi:hypothetical protein
MFKTNTTNLKANKGNSFSNVLSMGKIVGIILGVCMLLGVTAVFAASPEERLASNPFDIGANEQTSSSNSSTIAYQADHPVPHQNSDCVDNLRPSFSWEPVSGATHYTIAIYSTSQFEPGIESVYFYLDVYSTEFFPPEDLNPEFSYRWKVKANLVDGESPFSDSVYLTLCSQYVVWEVDPFDQLSLGSLNGQNGWVSNRASPEVVYGPKQGKVLYVDPQSGSTVSIGKQVPAQTDGLHRFQFNVMVTQTKKPSLAKIEIQTNSSARWKKKFQIYFGSSIRVNYSPNGGAVTIVPATQHGTWYHILCEMDLDTGLLDVWVDGVLAASNITMYPGPITSLGISGWARPGEVYLDTLHGISYDSAPPTTPTPSRTPSPTPMVSPTPTPTAFVTPTPTPTPIPPPNPAIWEQDAFDELITGPLHGQNGWNAYRSSAQVVEQGFGDRVLFIDPNPKSVIGIDKDVPDQTDGTRTFEFDVMVSGAIQPSLAKIEMNTVKNNGWNKKFQIYFGSTIRVNWGPRRGEAVQVVSTVQDGHWYHIRIDMDLDRNDLDIWVDGSKVGALIPMHTGPITGISISGWDRTGAVYLDNLLGSQ